MMMGEDTNAQSYLNPKTTLVELCQRFTGKSMDKGDITYTTNDFDGQFQSTVKINCVSGQEFAGDLCASQREAEHSAAAQALEGLKEDMGLARGAKRKNEDVYSLLKSEPLNTHAKSKLREAVKMAIGRDLAEGDMLFDISEAATGGYVCNLKIPCLPGALGTRSFFGSPSPFRRDTMLAAAAKALEVLMSDKNLGIDPDKVLEVEAMDEERHKNKKKAKKQGSIEGGLSGEAPPWRSKGASKGGKGGCGKGGCGKGAGGKSWGGGWDSWGVDPSMMQMMMSMMAGMKGGGKCGKGKGKDMGFDFGWGGGMSGWGSGGWGDGWGSGGGMAMKGGKGGKGKGVGAPRNFLR